MCLFHTRIYETVGEGSSNSFIMTSSELTIFLTDEGNIAIPNSCLTSSYAESTCATLHLTLGALLVSTNHSPISESLDSRDGIMSS